MRVKQYLRWELLLALSLVGCTSVVPNRIGLSQQAERTAEAPAAAPAGLNLGTRLLFQVRWPETSGYNAQFIPTETAKIEIKVVKSGMDPAAAGAVIEAATQDKPTDGTNTTTTTFKLDPALKMVDVHVRALGSAGQKLAGGQTLGVPVRDNTSMGVTVTLSTTDGLSDELKLRLANHLTLLSELPRYFEKYDQLVSYQDSTEVTNLADSLRAIAGPWMPQRTEDGAYPGDDPGLKPSAYRAGSRYAVQALGDLERLLNPTDNAQAMDVLNSELKKLYWPGYEATFTYTGADPMHSLVVDVGPPLSGGGDGTTARLRAEVSATSWLAEPALTQTMDAWLQVGSATSSVMRSITFLGGKKPADDAIKQATLAFDIAPKGSTLNAFGFSASLDGFRDVSNTPLYLALTERASASRQVTVAPMVVQIMAKAPALVASTSLTLNDDLLGLKSRTNLKARDNNDDFGDFLLDLGGSIRLGPINGHAEPVGGNFGFSLVDQARQLRLEGAVQVQRVPLKALFNARFVEVESNTVVGTIDYDLPIDANGRVDMNKLSSWPILKLMDEQRTQIPLTPGFFSGETTGHIQVDVR